MPSDFAIRRIVGFFLPKNLGKLGRCTITCNKNKIHHVEFLLFQRPDTLLYLEGLQCCVFPSWAQNRSQVSGLFVSCCSERCIVIPSCSSHHLLTCSHVHGQIPWQVGGKICFLGFWENTGGRERQMQTTYDSGPRLHSQHTHHNVQYVSDPAGNTHARTNANTLLQKSLKNMFLLRLPLVLSAEASCFMLHIQSKLSICKQAHRLYSRGRNCGFKQKTNVSGNKLAKGSPVKSVWTFSFWYQKCACAHSKMQPPAHITDTILRKSVQGTYSKQQRMVIACRVHATSCLLR